MNEIKHTNHISDVIQIIENEGSSTHVVAIWGASGSGKTYLSHALSEGIVDSRVINIDNYLSESIINGEYCTDSRYDECIEGINPQIWDQEKLNHDLTLSIDGSEIFMPQFDHQKRRREELSVRLGRASLTIIEGAYAYQNNILDNIDKLVLVDASLHDRFMRKLTRLLHKTQRTDIDESINRYLQCSQPSLEKYWSKYLPHADIVFENNFNPSNSIVGLSLPVIDDCFMGNVKLMPKDGYGKLSTGESLSILQEKNNVILRYSIGHTAVINSLITYNSLDNILRYYDER